ncbi:sigma-E factor regulatory protein RseB [Vibrio sp. vnigr-6D03]|uniref:Sigma-E factor regulatory protein RseB n=1 Tax=Vibrio penaeicida TaxID=104609 RepID=A0AAV5NTG4_9VIBR|nr:MULTISPECIES: sigma-E factor regulatory protein RseB [Vibrio]MDP2575651.1 sigma-E factor regulatory protein RseB [Vibrio penaeicida]PKF79311.1 sigma-E factor regulatory protein RseB [Vibrio sp. vnigr-6D03]RTZ24571.1 sigma-E factor regulatory protein RseB [Vibrio penaeicida]GLQ73768.1 sigma-E factor regulatory protein RseB [Vibrio penaeicida]
MKKILISVLALFSLNVHAASAEEISAEALLHQMNEASQQLSYELSYIQIKKNSIEPLLYRHGRRDDKQFARLVYLSGPSREVIRRDNEISYFEPGVDPFSIESGEMVAPLIPLINTNVTVLEDHYDFVKLGRAREAGTPCQVIRIVPKDGQRYSYVLWVDERTHLPLRADLVDRDGEVLEQYRTISYAVNDKIFDLLSRLGEAQLPDAISLPESEAKSSFWQVGWVPNGFKANPMNRYRMGMTNKVVESQMFNDGLFSFSVYVSEKDDLSLKGQLVRQGRRTLHSFVSGNVEVSVVGDIPPSTAKRVAQSVTMTANKTQ